MSPTSYLAALPRDKKIRRAPNVYSLYPNARRLSIVFARKCEIFSGSRAGAFLSFHFLHFRGACAIMKRTGGDGTPRRGILPSAPATVVRSFEATVRRRNVRRTERECRGRRCVLVSRGRKRELPEARSCGAKSKTRGDVVRKTATRPPETEEKRRKNSNTAACRTSYGGKIEHAPGL